ncbi:MAG: hypothetical protein K2W84_14995 [Burkholderiales bacterium]|nr:hypothetical protein [Burkholderiales bacterium]
MRVAFFTGRQKMMLMHKRQLDRQGPEVLAPGLGCTGMLIGYGVPDDAELIATIHRAINSAAIYWRFPMPTAAAQTLADALANHPSSSASSRRIVAILEELLH